MYVTCVCVYLYTARFLQPVKYYVTDSRHDTLT